MALDLINHQVLARQAIRAFWGNRGVAQQRQQASGAADTGSRGAVTAGKNLNGFFTLVERLVAANGLPTVQVHSRRSLVVLPGYFRPTKQWDMLVMNGGKLVAALEFKSQVGSFGNNYNNRTEEAIGTAQCLWTAYREGALGDHPPPFLGWLMVVEDAPASRSPVANPSPHFPVFAEFKDASYLDRYDQLCKRLVKEKLYTSAAVIATPSSAARDGRYRDLSELSSLDTLVRRLAAHVAAEAADNRTR